jgi:hypothetical protein
MPQPDSTQVLAIQQVLTNVSIAYTQQGTWIADRVFPVVPVERQGDIYWKYTRQDWFRGQAERRAPATESAGGGYRLATDSYYCNVYAVHRDVDDQTRVNYRNQFNLDSDATRWVTQQLMVKRDRLFLDTYFKSGLWTGGTSADKNVDWTAAGSGDPIMDVRTAADAIEGTTGYRPNTLVIPSTVLTQLQQHPDIIDRVKYTNSIPGGVGTEAVASALGVGRIVVANTVHTTADYLSGSAGTDAALAYMAGDGALLIYAAPSAGLMQPSAGYTFSWSGYMGNSGIGASIMRFRDERIKSDRIEGEMAFDMKVVAPDLGAWFATPSA